jgi:hypothetical protein
VEEYNLGTRAEITRQGRTLLPEYERNATVYNRANALLKLIPDQNAAASVAGVAQALTR